MSYFLDKNDHFCGQIVTSGRFLVYIILFRWVVFGSTRYMLSKTMIRQLIGIIVLMLLFDQIGMAQKKCTSNPTTISSNINFGSITWTASGGATVTECNNMADGISTFTGDVIVDLANNKKITITNNVNITGSFPISGGPGSILSVSGGFTLHVTGDLGDANNNGVAYEVVTSSDKIIVDGTLYGKNNNAFSGSGSISGGTLDVKNGASCGSPCPVAGGFTSCMAGGTFCTDNGVLPVSLIAFSAHADEQVVTLSWATASELNFDYFAVERSLNGSNFEEIGQVVGHGTTEERHDYSFVDNSPFIQKLYYRLKTIDFDGYSEYFNIAAVDFGGDKKIWVYPNPVTDGFINIQFNFMPEIGTEIQVTDMRGIEKLKQVAGQEFQFKIPISSGAYFIRVNSTDFNSVHRVLVK